MKLSVLDQSPVVAGRSPSHAIAETMDLVERAEALGYHRYWFAEHHGSASFASAQPAVMMAHAAARTKRIRLGSGGILMGHAKPLDIAESIRTLEALAPGRIDLGMGRAPGGDQRVMSALGYAPQRAPQNIVETLKLLRDQRVASNVGDVVAVPDGGAASAGENAPEAWMLGTSVDSARMAGEMGLRYAFGSFIDPTNMDAALGEYHRSFVASAWCERPTTLVATVVFCADTTSEAHRIAECSEKWFVRSFLRGENVRFPASSDVVDVTAQERFISQMQRSTVIIGNPQECKTQLEQLQRRTQCDEVAVVTITEDHAERLRSYELLMMPGVIDAGRGDAGRHRCRAW